MNSVYSGFPISAIQLFSLGITAKVLKPKTDLKSFQRNVVSLAQNFRYKGPPSTILPVRKLDEWSFYMVLEFWQ